MKKLRTSTKAIIIRNDQILTIEKYDDQGSWFLLPGGGQNYGETLDRALIRECKEETGADVKVKEFAFIREYISTNHEFAYKKSGLHQVETYFYCDLLSEPSLDLATELDNDQKGFVWIPLKDIKNFRLYPKFLLEALQKKDTIYYGDRN